MTSDTYEAGRQVVRELLGPQYLEFAGTSGKPGEFGAELVNLAFRFAFGEIWARPGLERKHRSMITLAIFIAMGKHAEFEIHLKGGLNAGLTASEIEEIIMHSIIYAGFPAAGEALVIAQRVLKERGLI
jgi:4-carboxymuconolactone decarboxylase